ncbi:MAG: EAL domain-containing protein [Pseudomonadota bacterium]
MALHNGNGHDGPVAVGTILVVEDDATLARGIERMLSAAGFTIMSAGNGHEALAILAEAQIDLVPSDIGLPGMDGIALLKAVIGRDLDLPFVLVTGQPSLETAIEAVEYGAFHYLTKPFSSRTLVALANRAVKTRRLAQLRRQALLLAGIPGGTRDLQGLQAAFDRALLAFYMAFQPIVHADEGELYGHEALLRPSEPSLPHPGAMLHAAESLGRVPDLGRAIRRRAANALGERGPSLGSLFINLHPSDLTDEDLVDPEAPLTRHAQQVVLEVTERSTLDGVHDLRGRIERLRELGFRIAVDDLGAGYSGLNSFVALQPDLVKLDMTLVREVERDPTRQKLVRSMATLCHDMGILVVAEGIQTQEEREVLTTMGCDLLQGFHVGRPLPLASLGGLA